MEYLLLERWSPYIAGIGIGILSWFTFLLSDKPIGCSTSFVTTSGMIEKLFQGDKVNRKAYYQKHIPAINWQLLFVIGIFIGAFLSAWLSGQFEFRWLPQKWLSKFGLTPVLRTTTAFLGGILMGLGSRWANGCTSGHGISGAMQLTVSSWLATICFFAGGLIVAFLIY